MIDYIRGFRTVLGAWRQVTLSYKNMLSISPFNPYTQLNFFYFSTFSVNIINNNIHCRPIINGYVDQKTCGNGPNFDFLLDLDKELEDLMKMIERILRHSFQISDKYIKAFDSIRIFCLENQSLDLDIFREEKGIITSCQVII
jgi:hypothetical protein